MRYLLDEDVNPAVARVARGRGVDVRSVHELVRYEAARGEAGPAPYTFDFLRP